MRVGSGLAAGRRHHVDIGIIADRAQGAAADFQHLGVGAGAVLQAMAVAVVRRKTGGVAGAHLGISDGFRLAEPSPEQILDLALGTWEPRADGMIVACLNFRSQPIIDALEARTGKPVVTSTQAVLWHALRLAGVSAPISGYGRLLREY